MNSRFCLRLTLVEQAEDKPYSVLSKITITANEVSTNRYKQYAEAGLEYVGRQILLEALKGSKGFQDYQVLITDNLPQVGEMAAYDPTTGAGLKVEISCRRLGEDTGRNIVLHLGKQASGIIDHIGRNMRSLTAEERDKVQKIAPF